MSKFENTDARIAHIAHHLVIKKVAHGLSKAFCKANGLDVIRSVGTERSYKQHVGQYLHWRASLALDLNGPHTTVQMQQFLFEKEEVWQQSQLDVCKQALQKVFSVKLKKARSQRVTVLEARAYSTKEVAQITARQTLRNRFSTLLCFQSGARAHELLTIRRANELGRSSDRPWRDDLFIHGAPVVMYCVKGKGGLERFIGIPVDLADELESRRLAKPVPVRDRGVEYDMYYDIGAGQALSQSFNAAAVVALGSSTGLHGLRHSYAQRRMAELTGAGVSFTEALLIVSQEMGHFRPEITLTYLR